MIKHHVIAVFEALDIQGVHEDALLERDLGMDSQEIVSLTAELQERFRIPLEDGVITRKMTVAEVIDLVQRLVDATNAPTNLSQPGPSVASSEGSLIEEVMIDAPVEVIYHRLHHVQDWPLLLPHVQAINMVYDDGRYQEFFMNVQGVDGNTVKVRSIRKCEKDEITFFQPEPPKFLAKHSGGWRFKADGMGHCIVTTYHCWSLSDQAGAIFPATNTSTASQVEQLLREHARLALIPFLYRFKYYLFSSS